MATAPQKATLINSAGKKVVVVVGSPDVKKYYGQGYTLMTGKNSKPASPGTAAPTPAAPNPAAPSPVPAGGTPTGPSLPGVSPQAPWAEPAPTDPSVDPLSRAAQEKNNNVYLGSMDQVKAAQYEGKNVQLIGNDWYVVNDESFRHTKVSGGPLSRSSLEAKGWKYVGDMDAVKAGQKAGKNMQIVAGNWYEVPKRTVGTTDSIRNGKDASSTTGTGSTTGGTGTSGPTQTPYEQNFPTLPGMEGKEAPDAPDLIDTYNVYNSTYKIEDAQKVVDDAQSELDALDAAYMAGTHEAQNQLKPMEILRGDAAKLGQQYNEKRFLAQNKLSLASRILEGKQKMVDTMVSLTGKNYEYASQAYNDSYSRSMEMAKFTRSNMESDRTFAQAVKQAEGDDARANLTAFGNALVTAGKSWKDLTATQKAMVREMETKAGLPVGTMENFVAAKPQAKLLTTTTDDNGNVHFIYADANGMPGIVKVVKGVSGKYHSSSTTTTPDGQTPLSLSAVGEPKKDSSGGYSFSGTFGTGKNAQTQPITAAQYAAAKRKSVLTILDGSNDGDKKAAATTRQIVATAKSEKWSADQLLGVLQGEYGNIFNGITSDQLKDTVGF